MARSLSPVSNPATGDKGRRAIKAPPAAKAKASGRKTPLKTSSALVPTRPGKNGGVLQVGNPGNRGNVHATGRPRSVIRDDLAGAFDEAARPFLLSVVRGDCVQTMRIPVKEAAEHLTCPNCGEAGGKLVPTDPLLGHVSVEVEVSAPLQTRVSVSELLAKYGVGQMKELSADSVKERIGKQLDIMQGILPIELFERICKAIEPVWR